MFGKWHCGVYICHQSFFYVQLLLPLTAIPTQLCLDRRAATIPASATEGHITTVPAFARK